MLMRWLAALFAILLLAACERVPQQAGPTYSSQAPAADKATYRLAVHPLHNPSKLFESYQPLIDLLNARIPEARFALEASNDYQDYERKFRARGAELLLPNPWQTLEANKVGYHVLAMAGDAEDFKGLFLARRDSTIRQPADLKGKAVSYPSATALAACIMPQWWLHERGLDINRDLDNRYVGSQESAIMNAYLKQSAVAATWPPPWRAFQKDHPREAAELVQMWETPPLINNSVMAHDDVPSSIIARLREVLLSRNDSSAGLAVLAGMETARFHPADDARYDEVRAFIARFERAVRPVESR